jgi:hypothetical protein
MFPSPPLRFAGRRTPSPTSSPVVSRAW